MPRLVVAPDAFKGTLPASRAARAMVRGCRQAGWRGEIIPCPLADGGEGTLEVLRPVLPEAEPVASPEGPWLRCRIDGRETAVVESARLLGHDLPAMRSLPVERRGSAALGRLLRSIIDTGIDSLVVALGGTAVNDAGLGLLLALGLTIRGRRSRRVPDPDLAGLMRLVDEGLGTVGRPPLAGIDLRVLCDVDSPLSGPRGATWTFGRQKGLAEERLPVVDAAVATFARGLEARWGLEVHERPGAGAAGGLGFALALLGGRLVGGADWVIGRVDLASLIAGAECVLTGEGASDGQTLAGKLPWRVAALARRSDVPAVLVSGRIEPAARPVLRERFERLIEAPAMPGDAETPLTRAIADSGLFAARHLW